MQDYKSLDAGVVIWATHRQTHTDRHTQTDIETNRQTAFDRLDLTAACNNP